MESPAPIKINLQNIIRERRSAVRTKFFYRLEPTTAAVICDALRNRGWTQIPEDCDQWDLFWCEVNQLRNVMDGHRLGRNQYVPHFRNHYELSTKNQLARNIKRLKHSYIKEDKTNEAKACDCVPTTFEIPSEYHMFVEEYRKHPGATWIVKPAVGSKGRGIFLFKKHKSLVDWRNQKSKLAEETGQEMEPWVVQTYIEDPYLIAGRKFDLRIFVLVTSFFPLKVWMARDGFARMAGAEYSLTELENCMAHLTNMSIQLSPTGDNKQGCKWSMRNLRIFLTAKHGHDVVENLVQKIAEVVMISLRSVQSAMMQNNRCFELYGYDILLQSDLTPWLLEVNASPSMTATNGDDYKLKYSVIQDVFNVLDLEGNRLGCETRVGGFDMIWNDGPVFAPCPGANKFGPRESKKKLNVFLGCRNDREEQLDYLAQWKKYVEPKQHSPP